MSLIPTRGFVHLIQLYVIKFVSNLRQVSTSVFTSKIVHNNLIVILLKVALNTITLTLEFIYV
jgi:hypothetical protein